MLRFSEENTRKKAIAYYRHSAEDKQENSVPIQRELAEKFVSGYNVDIIHEEADEGKSGLLATRPGFERLFSDWILNDSAPHFDYILVYDVSRWGRFQDPDEAAYYEFRCKQRGKKVVYITRGFPREEQTLMAPLQTSIERYMAAEYSRQLSDKVFHGCVKVSQQGYSAGGMAPYGMGRLLLDANKRPKAMLKRGEHKAIDNERVTFAPLNDKTTEAVKEMFQLLIQKWLSPSEIVKEINKTGTKSHNGKEWNTGKIMRILTNETYTGTRIYNKTWNRLKQGHRPNSRNEWVFCQNAHESIINTETFDHAQEHLYWLMRTKHQRGKYLIRKVRQLFKGELNLSFEKQGIGHDKFVYLIKNFPLVFATTFFVGPSRVPHWCFLIPPGLRQFPYVIGVGLNMDKKRPIDKYFVLEQDYLLADTMHIISENDARFSAIAVTEDAVETKISELLHI